MGQPTHQPGSSVDTFKQLDHYQALGLAESASSEDVSRSLHVERWPWHLVDEAARQQATARRVEAYRILSHPASRAEYDRNRGYTARKLAGRIGDAGSIWARTWLILFGILAILLFIGGYEHPARLVGDAFAPDFEEVVVRTPCEFQPCSDFLEREFRSSSDAWQSLLNGVFIWFLPAAVAVVLGLGLFRVTGWSVGYCVAAVRLSGRRDDAIRTLMLVLVAAVPVGILLFYWLAAPDPVPLPGER